MKIALNARHMMQDRLEGIGTVTHEVMKRMVASHPEDRFDYYFDRPYQPQFIHGPNVMPHAFGPPARLPALIRYWLKYPVASDVRIRKSDVFFSPDGFVPLKLKIPKVSIIHDIAYKRYPEYFTPRIRMFYKHWMPEYLAHTDRIITVSQFSKSEVMMAYGIPAEKISVVYNGVSTGYQPFHEKEIQSFRDECTYGKPYFLYLGAIHPRKNVMTLIRAFEQFKAQHASEHVLILAGRVAWAGEDVLKAIDDSPWKADMMLAGFVDRESARAWMACAFALVYPSFYEGFGLPLLEAMASGVPVISSNSSSLPEVAGDAALLFNPEDVDQLAHHLNTIYTNQYVREDLIKKGNEQVKKFSWEKAAAETYTILLNASGHKES